MALTKIIGEGIQGISNSSNATAITIDSNERVLTPARPAFLARRNDTTTSLSSGDIFIFDSVSIYGGFGTASGYNTSTYTYKYIRRP